MCRVEELPLELWVIRQVVDIDLYVFAGFFRIVDGEVEDWITSLGDVGFGTEEFGEGLCGEETVGDGIEGRMEGTCDEDIDVSVGFFARGFDGAFGVEVIREEEKAGLVEDELVERAWHARGWERRGVSLEC